MYWDVIEVRAEPDYCLFVRLKDGLTGRVRLREEDAAALLAFDQSVLAFLRLAPARVVAQRGESLQQCRQRRRF